MELFVSTILSLAVYFLYHHQHLEKANLPFSVAVRDASHFKGEELLKNTNTTAHTIEEAVREAEAVLVATPPQFAENLIVTLGGLSGKVLMDASNAVRTRPPNYPTAYHAFEALTKAEVVKCFNSTGFENMQNPNYGHTRLDMFMAGGSPKAKAVAVQLASDAGFENCHDFGGSDRVELLEKFALSWTNLAIMQGMGRDIGFKLVRREPLVEIV